MSRKEQKPGISRPILRRLENHDVFPIAALEAVAEARRYLDQVERAAVLKARRMGATYEDLALALGISRQTVFNRYRHEDPTEQE